MNIASNLFAKLDSLTSSPSSPDAALIVEMSLQHSQLVCHLTASGRLACEVREITLLAPQTEPWGAEELQRFSTEVCQRLSYLLEPIAPVEVDQQTAVVQMRSAPPSADEQAGRSYYELLARPGHFSLKRYHKQPGLPRAPRSMHLTREVLARLLRDVDEMIGSCPE